jgi:FkbM family methyltransferase
VNVFGVQQPSEAWTVSRVRESWTKLTRRLNGKTESELRDRLVAREKAIVERENVICQRETVIAQREAEIAGQHGLIIEREAEIAGQHGLIIEREAEIKRLHGVVREQSAVIDARLTSLQRQEARLFSREATLKARGFVAARRRDEALASRQTFDLEAALSKWAIEAERLKHLQQRGAQTLISPYIVERQVYGSIYRMLIATDEGWRWYDNLQSSEAHLAQSLGMIRSGDIVLDCGCNQGFNALIYSDIVGESGKVLAFDPFPANIAIGRFNAELNDRRNIDFVEAGVWAERATASVSVLEQCVSLTDANAPDLISIDLISLDTYAALKPSYLKIDVEGAEIDALAGAQEVISQAPTMYIEIHPNFLPRFNRKAMDVFNYVSLSDYQCYINYPNMPALSIYDMEFDLTEPCALFLIPRDRPPIIRYFLANG